MSFRPSASPTASSSSSSSLSTADCLSGLFQFVSGIGALSVNAGHCPSQLSVVPRKLHVLVELRTVALHGLSYADFQLATHIDGLERASKKHRSNPRRRQPVAGTQTTAQY